MPNQPELTEVEVKRGYWLYAGELHKTVIIQRLNYDVYYELEKDSFFDLSNGVPQLNTEGYTCLVVWPEEDFIYPPGSWSVPLNEQELSLEGAISYAEATVKQPINWIT